jgi:hypothetical protein
MVVPIPYARTYTTTVTGSVLKIAQCENCRTPYGYDVSAVVSGSGTSFLFLDNEGARACY